MVLKARSRARTSVALLCLVVATPVPAEPTTVDKGRHALESRCSRCHAIGPDGTSPHAEAPPFRDVVKRYPPESLEESLAEGITSGHADMPEFVLSPDEIAGVVAYLHTLEQKNPAAGD